MMFRSILYLFVFSENFLENGLGLMGQGVLSFVSFVFPRDVSEQMLISAKGVLEISLLLRY